MNIGDRRNKRGKYKYVTLAIVIPAHDAVEGAQSVEKASIEETNDELENELKIGSEEPENEVKTNEV